MAYAASTTSGNTSFQTQPLQPLPLNTYSGASSPTYAASTTSGNISPTQLSLGTKATSPTSNLSSGSNLLPTAYAATTPTPTGSTTPSAGSTTNPLYALPGETYAQYEARMGATSGTAGSGTGFGTPTGTASSPTSQPPAQQNTGLYGTLINNLATKSMQPNQDYTTAQSGLNALGTGSNPDVTASRNALLDFQKQYASQQAAIEGTPIPLEFQQGRGQILANQYANELPAYQTGVQNALTAQGQQISALGTSLGAANTQQGLQLQGLGTAAGLAAPQQVSYSNQFLNPITGQPINPQAGAALQGAVANYAQLVKNNQMSYQDAVSALSAYGPVGQQALTQALGPGFNVNTSAGTAAGQQATTSQQYGQIQSYTSALQQGQNLQSQLTDLITAFGLNPNDINAVNSGLQAIARNTSNPYYKLLNNYINDIANTYATILTPPGGSATDTTRGIASSMLDATASGQSLMTVMKGLDQQAQAKIAGISTQGTANDPLLIR